MKKIIKIIGIIICIAVLVLNISFNYKTSSDNIDLTKLLKEANATCAEITDNTVFKGHCMADDCYDTGHNLDCNMWGL